ncbi:hypothetical protein NPS01_38010 [Nocardioides psychrotolerans]|uniref:Sensor-like histidine kinase SenX3 n=1 Tax=Nocardioides psychrotolerans TaxID=1005945 RepID=A0A1I3I9B7_9ACTN|nr:HAMP domain-containing sensor histidine kinase [Nocardioides psychrotolerans]GEP40138.1 hypothetical protein NPS01_38010 [Nocardioides psychrotolerans]SFI44499.1 two-component system, OmpR family, sensor kinase [Nocardioides psychrotolerans]
MPPTEGAQEQALLDEMSRINNDYGVLQRRTAQALARTRHELAETQNVLGMVAHDLLTPLQAVAGFAEFLLDEPNLTEQQRHLVDRIAHSAEMMTGLTDELLQSMDVGASSLVLAPVDLVALVDSVSSRYRLLGNAVSFDRNTPAVKVDGDAIKLERMLDNLVTNALKFSPEGEQVEIAVVDEGPTVVLSVSDHGPGIAPEQHAAIFAPFHRAPGTAAAPGVGLGLAIVRQIVERHGGTVSVDSDLGQGATFVLRLPVMSPRPTSKA